MKQNCEHSTYDLAEGSQCCPECESIFVSTNQENSSLSEIKGKKINPRCSVPTYTYGEWTQRNANLLSANQDALAERRRVDNHCKNTMNRTYAFADQAQGNNTKLLEQRSLEIFRWKTTMNLAIKALADEIELMEKQLQRIKHLLLNTLKLVGVIVKECLDLRCGRIDSEQVQDPPEIELINELSLLNDITSFLTTKLEEVEKQLVDNRSARELLEHDWSDKEVSFRIDSINCGLDNSFRITMFNPGAAKHINEQSSVEEWENHSKNIMERCERTRQFSIKLRETLDAYILCAARNLRSQADKVEKALAAKISLLEGVRVKLENDLRECLIGLAETEKLIEKLKVAAQNMDNTIMVVQTRLDNRNQRPRVESCRDVAQFSLIEEERQSQIGITRIRATIEEAEATKSKLMTCRNGLEREIALKKRSIMLDRQRCLILRSHFPSVTALSGY